MGFISTDHVDTGVRYAEWFFRANDAFRMTRT